MMIKASSSPEVPPVKAACKVGGSEAEICAHIAKDVELASQTQNQGREDAEQDEAQENIAAVEEHETQEAIAAVAAAATATPKPGLSATDSNRASGNVIAAKPTLSGSPTPRRRVWKTRSG